LKKCHVKSNNASRFKKGNNKLIKDKEEEYLQPMDSNPKKLQEESKYIKVYKNLNPVHD
jgi:hypothetical protein